MQHNLKQRRCFKLEQKLSPSLLYLTLIDWHTEDSSAQWYFIQHYLNQVQLGFAQVTSLTPSYPILSYPILSYPILFSSIRFYLILSYSILFYPIPSYSILFYSILSYSILFYPILFSSILFYSILFYSILFYSIFFNSFFCLYCTQNLTFSILLFFRE